jgi:hypothetical protein
MGPLPEKRTFDKSRLVACRPGMVALQSIVFFEDLWAYRTWPSLGACRRGVGSPAEIKREKRIRRQALPQQPSRRVRGSSFSRDRAPGLRQGVTDLPLPGAPKLPVGIDSLHSHLSEPSASDKRLRAT